MSKIISMNSPGILLVVDDKTTIHVPEGTEIKLTTTQENFNTCIYIGCRNGKITFTGGADIIESIEGQGMAEKIK